MILLDTHAFVWLNLGIDKLGGQSRALIEQKRNAEHVHVSVMSCWEMAMLVERGCLALLPDARTWVVRALTRPGIITAPLTPEIALDAGSLPGDIHGDPADRVIVATARALGCPLLTSDRAILAYAQAGHVEAIDAHL